MEPQKPYNIKGVISYNNEPLSGVKITSHDSEVYTMGDGSFRISGAYTDVFNITCFKEGYSIYYLFPFDSQNNIKSNIGVVELSPLTIESNQTLKQLQSLSDTEVNGIISSKTNFETLQQKKLIDIISNLKFVLLPIIVQLFVKFGISNIKEALLKKQKALSCPTPEEIEKIISKKNKLVKQLDITYKIITSTTTVVNTTLVFITVLETSRKLLLLAPYPSPPSVSFIGEEIDKKIKKYKSVVTTTSLILNTVKITLKEIIDYLNLLDNLIQECSPNTVQDQEKISTGLIELTQEQSVQQSPVVTEVNGFKMEVEIEKTENNLKRKRAIARNKKGLVMLQGEWSFSSIDQILIDELVFYIQQNNLKAD